MISDAILSASISVASSNPKDFSKKKRVNRTAKLKQCKLDARREQWLSHVKHKDACNNEVNGAWSTSGENLGYLVKDNVHLLDKLEIKSGADEEHYENGSSTNHCSDTDSSPSNSPTGCALGSNHRGTNFTESGLGCSRTSSSRSSSISSNGCRWGTTSEGEDGDADDDDECLDDWEAVADALAVTDKMKEEHSPNSVSVSSTLIKHENSAKYSSCMEATVLGINILNGKQESGGRVQKPPANSRAWRADDAFRPPCLPNLSKQCSLPSNTERHLGFGGSARGCQDSRPTSCPICFEDLDCTDSSFMPCLCGFRLCLFCHKRILEEDGRCPGCRKQYDNASVGGETDFDGGRLTYRLARSCSMITRS